MDAANQGRVFMNPFEWIGLILFALVCLGLAFREARKRKEHEDNNKQKH